MKHKFVDLGKKVERPAEVAVQEGHSAQEMNYPEVHIEHDQIPVGPEHLDKHIHATIKAHVKGISHEKDHKGNTVKRVHLAIHGISVHPGAEEGAEHEGAESVDEEKAEHPHAGSKKHADRMSKIKDEYAKGEE